MWSLSDESLLVGLASGDTEAATAFVRRFQGRIYGLALAIVGDAATAEDVAQETFIRAWKHAGAYDPRRGRVSTWVLSIAKNLAIDALRFRRYDPVAPDGIAAMQVFGFERGPEDNEFAPDEVVRLSRAIAALPVEQRHALVLAGLYGWTAREISEREKIPLGTVKTRIRTAMLKLRSQLEVKDEQ